MRDGRQNSESGIVLVVVLGGILILTTIVFALAMSVRAGAEEVQNRKERLQAYYLARGAVFTTSWLLTKMSPAPDAVLHPGQRSTDWEQPIGKVHVDITDESGKIDINQVQKPLLEKLFMALGYQLEIARPLASAIVDWRDPSSLVHWESVQASGNLLEYDPTSAKYRYGAVEELLNVPGVKPQIFYGHYIRHDDGKIERVPGLVDCVTVDSGGSSININYAPRPVLLAATNMNTQAADDIVAGRDRKPFASVEDITREFPVSLGEGASSTLTTQSSGAFSLVATGQTPGGTIARVLVGVKVPGTDDKPFQITRWKDSHVQ